MQQKTILSNRVSKIRIPNILVLRATPETQAVLAYPPAWKVHCNPLAKEMDRRALQWMRDIGVICDADAEDRFEKLTVWAAAGWPFPQADGECFETIVKFQSLWIFYDDIIEERDDGIMLKIREAIAGQPAEFPGGSPHYRGWWELGQSYGKVMSPAWMQRHARRFYQWILSVREESQIVQSIRQSGHYPSAASHLARRAINIGMIPNSDFVEYQMGWELPESLVKDPDMERLQILAAEVVAIGNDLFSYTKDREGRWSNLIPSLHQEFQISLEEAFQWAATMHNARIREIGHLEEQLRSKVDAADRSSFEAWIMGMRHVVYGIAKQHSVATRYRSVHEFGEGRQARIVLQDE